MACTHQAVLLCALVELLPERPAAWDFPAPAAREQQPHQEGLGFPASCSSRSTIGSLLVTILIEFSVLGIILLIVGNTIIPWIPVVLLLTSIETLFVFGIALAPAV
ncbi:MAG: hypothetical protein U0W40_07725 [Acidimicrobiia bacterium]